MIIADYFRINQKKMPNRLWIALPLFVASFALTNMDFTILWRYFSWANQSTAMIALWVGAMYLVLAGKNHWVASIPATFMTMATFTYILNAPIGFGLPMELSYILAAIGTLIVIALFVKRARAYVGTRFPVDEQIESAYEKAPAKA
jgi:carbon starvation protein CstA